MDDEQVQDIPIYTFGERAPERDHYVIFDSREDRPIAYRTTMEEHNKYVARYGDHSAALRWAYGVPAGMRAA